MFVLDGTIVIFVISFLIFIKLLDLWMLQPVGKVIAMRQERIQNDLESARQNRQKAGELMEGYETHLGEKRSDAQALVTSAVSEANRLKSEKLSAVRQEALAGLEKARASMAAEKTAILDQLVSHESELVEEIARKVLGEPVTVQLDPEQVRRRLEETT